MARILVIDDDAAMRLLVARGLQSSPHDIEDAPDGEAGLALLEKREYDVVLTDLRMSATDGMDVLSKCLELRPCPAVILMSGYGTIEVAIAAIKKGAFDFVQKPFDLQHMILKIEQALEMRRLQYQVDYLTGSQSAPGAFDNIVGANGTLLRALMIVRKVAKSGASILILGETGTGKELIASAVHNSSERAGKAFVKVNCAALHEHLLESELFGHEKGAFTSADRQRLGRFEQADGGTMFLDEIGDMSLSTQAKVLRVLQEHEFERLGSSKTLKVNVRILAATHRNLAEMVTNGTFRADLFYRLNVVSIDLPPLRERRDDIPALARHFVSQLCADLKKPAKEISADALAALTAHQWPGNIRELQNVLERALLLGDGPVLRSGDLTLGR